MISLKLESATANKYINYLFMGYAFCLPISKAGTNLLEILIVLLWVFSDNWKEKLRLYKENPFILSISLFISISIISIFWANDFLNGLAYISKYHHLLIIPAIYLALEKKHINTFLYLFIAGMVVSGVMTHGIYFELWNYKSLSPSQPSAFMNRVDYSIYLSLSIILVLIQLVNAVDLKNKLIHLALSLFFMATLFINTGRTGYVTFIIAFALFIILSIKNKLKAIIISMSLTSIIVLSAYYFSPNFQQRVDYTIDDISGVVDQDNYKKPFSIRLSLWIVGFDKIKDNIWGYGIGNDMIDIQQYAQKRHFDGNFLANQVSDHHNFFITTFIQLGIIGFISLLYIFYTLAKLKFTSQKYKILNYIFVTVFILYTCGGLTLHLMTSMVLFAFIGGLLNATAYLENNRVKQS
ncbi:MAG: O-antigen ligase family protein [Gammaproteobacteria bacterium]|nr:O-antigen ligase family protein [Gammaproteobacteria bacterium]